MTAHARNVSFWIDTTQDTSYPQLSGDIEVDVAIVGGGICGLTCGYLLKQAGLSVAVLEAHRIASSVTGYTTAKVSSQHGMVYQQLEQKLGADKARMYGESNEQAKELISRLIDEHGIDCDFQRLDAYVYTEDDEKTAKQLRQEADTAASLGLPASFAEGDIGLPFPVMAAVRFTNQAQFHPRRYLLPLAERIDGDGGYIYEKTEVAEIEDGDPCAVTTSSGHTVRARDVITATHLPIQYRGQHFAKAFPHRGYVVAGRLDAPPPRGIYITASGSTRSVRTASHEGSTVLIVSGAGHKTGEEHFTEDRYRQLEDYARERFGVDELRWRWSTQDYTSADEVPFVGKLSGSAEHIYVATAFASWGMTNGTVAAMLLSDVIRGRDNPWLELYDSTRTLSLLKSAGTLIKENLDAGRQLISGTFKDTSDEGDIAGLAPGEGIIASVDGEKLAVQRDDQGQLTAVSARCTHMGCVVEYNPSETSWDCPCHGSRFRTDGQVIQGPATEPLEDKTELLSGLTQRKADT